jgi:hypothetical protein
LIGNGSLGTALRLATVATIINNRVMLEDNVRHRFFEGLQTTNGREYICLLQDLAFLAGFCTLFFKINANEVLWPQHLINADLHNDAKGKIQYGNLFHQFIASMITNRPIHCYGRLESPIRAQRTLWKYEFENQPPINFMHVCDNHFVALLPKDHDTTRNERYTYLCYFMHDEDNIAFLERQVVPQNELRSNNDRPVIIDMF